MVLIVLACLVFSQTNAHAWAWALALRAFGTASAWTSTGRNLSTFIKAIPSAGSGVVPAIKQAWTSFHVPFSEIAALSACVLTVYNWDIIREKYPDLMTVFESWAATVAGWVKVGTDWFYTQNAVEGHYVPSDTRVWDLYPTYLLLQGGAAKFGPPSTINIVSFKQSLSAADTVAQAKKSEMQAAGYITVTITTEQIAVIGGTVERLVGSSSHSASVRDER